jgi:hypothetical protein
MVTTIEGVINAFVQHLWNAHALDATAARTEFFKEHHMDAADTSTIPHYCNVCGVLNTVQLPRLYERTRG